MSLIYRSANNWYSANADAIDGTNSGLINMRPEGMAGKILMISIDWDAALSGDANASITITPQGYWDAAEYPDTAKDQAIFISSPGDGGASSDTSLAIISGAQSAAGRGYGQIYTGYAGAMRVCHMPYVNLTFAEGATAYGAVALNVSYEIWG